MTRPRDTQRAKLYRAEAEAFAGTVHSRIFGDGSIMAMRIGLLDRIERDLWMRRTFFGGVRREFRVHDGRGRQNAGGAHFALWMPKWSRTPRVLLHEVTHAIGRGWHDAGGAHGWQFAGRELQLVRHFLGTEAHDRLRAAFKRHRVRYTKPRTLSPDARAAASARLAAFRIQQATSAPVAASVPSASLDLARARANGV